MSRSSISPTVANYARGAGGRSLLTAVRASAGGPLPDPQAPGNKHPRPGYTAVRTAVSPYHEHENAAFSLTSINRYLHTADQAALSIAETFLHCLKARTHALIRFDVSSSLVRTSFSWLVAVRLRLQQQRQRNPLRFPRLPPWQRRGRGPDALWSRGGGGEVPSPGQPALQP